MTEAYHYTAAQSTEHYNNQINFTKNPDYEEYVFILYFLYLATLYLPPQKKNL